MRSLTLFLIAFSSVIPSFHGLAQEKLEAYRIYSSNGKVVSFEEMTRVLAKNDVVLFGEMHNNPIDHWL